MSLQETNVSSWENADFSDESENKSELGEQCFSNCGQTSHYENVFLEKGKIGKGGFGQVFHVQNRFDGEEYAVKKILLTGNNYV
jgi:serine/threonine protein kinase